MDDVLLEASAAPDDDNDDDDSVEGLDDFEDILVCSWLSQADTPAIQHLKASLAEKHCCFEMLPSVILRPAFSYEHTALSMTLKQQGRVKPMAFKCDELRQTT